MPQRPAHGTGRALVLGANGQDGTFLCRSLATRGYEVHGVGRQRGPREPIEHYHQVDLRSTVGLAAVLTLVRPSVVFHLAAVHNRAGLPYEEIFGDMLTVNVSSVHVVLEYLRRRAPGGRLVFASSAKAFGSPLPAVVDEGTPRRSDCLYAITKNAAAELIAYYRRTHAVAGSILYFFNHESELRPAGFFIPKVVDALRRALADSGSPEEFDTLDFHCDWGSAEEYMDVTIDVLERAPNDDFVVATGRSLHARALVDALFAHHGLRSADWVRERQPDRRGDGPYRVDVSKLARLVGRRPAIGIEALVERLVAAPAGDG